MTRDELAPLKEKSDGWWIDASRLTPDVPEWGPYATRPEAEEDRGPLVNRIKEEMKCKLS